MQMQKLTSENLPNHSPHNSLKQLLSGFVRDHSSLSLVMILITSFIARGKN